MKPQAYSVRLSSDQKLQLILRSQNGESVTRLCSEAKVSRTIFYRWVKEFKDSKYNKENEALSAKNPHGDKHWNKIKVEKEREIHSLWLNNPEYSIRRIAKDTKVSTGAVWGIINKYKKLDLAKEKVTRRYLRKSYRQFTPDEKIELLKRHKKGEYIARLCTEAGISRTIFYRWMKQYEKCLDTNSEFEAKRPRGVEHWRFIPGVRDLIGELIVESPQLSLSGLQQLIVSGGQEISRSGVYYILKSMNLTTPEARLAYAKSYLLTPFNPEVIPSVQSKAPKKSFFIPQFAILSIISLIGVGMYLFYSHLNPVVKIAPPIALEITQTPSNNSHTQPRGNNLGFSGPSKNTNQDFKWGAISVNSPRSHFLPGKQSMLGFGVVDHLGQTVCDAKISIEISGLNGNSKLDNLTSESSAIKPSGECSLQSVTNNPDYIATIPPIDKSGQYNLHVVATTYEGKKDFNYKLVVGPDPTIDVNRSSYPSRIFPEASYPVEIVITPKQDFQGTISENLPKGITASNISGNGVMLRKNGTQDHIIKLDVDLKKDKPYKLSYNLHFPRIWPEYYEIGPMRFEDSAGKLVFQELKYWQVVADALDK